MKAVIAPSYHSLKEFIIHLPARFEQEGETLYQGRNVVKRFAIDGEDWIVKRYKRPIFIQRFVYTFLRKSKAERAYLYAERLLQSGIATPDAVAYIECKHHGLLRDSYFVSTPCYDDAVITKMPKVGDFDKQLADAVVLFIVKLHESGIMHGDLNFNNILYRIDDRGKYVFTLIDTNRSRFMQSPSKEDCIKNLERITHNKTIMEYVARKYADIRDWDADRTAEQVLLCLDKFERRKEMKKILKRKK